MSNNLLPKESEDIIKKAIKEFMLDDKNALKPQGMIILIIASFSLTRGIITLLANKNKYKKIKY